MIPEFLILIMKESKGLQIYKGVNHAIWNGKTAGNSKCCYETSTNTTIFYYYNHSLAARILKLACITSFINSLPKNILIDSCCNVFQRFFIKW